MIDRRRLCSALVTGGAAVGTAALGIPALLAAISPAWKGRQGPAWRPAGPLADFAPGEIKPVEIAVGRGDWARSLERKTVYVWRQSENEVVVYSRNCTDLSCPLAFDPGSECFFCPCHGGIFGKDGQPMAGPPKQPLYRYRNRVRNGVVEIDLYSLPPMT